MTEEESLIYFRLERDIEPTEESIEALLHDHPLLDNYKLV